MLQPSFHSYSNRWWDALLYSSDHPVRCGAGACASSSRPLAGCTPRGQEKMKKSDDIPINSISVLTSAGKLYFDNNKFDLAMKAFNDALKKVNSSGGDNADLKSNILLNLANVQTAHGDTDKVCKLLCLSCPLIDHF